MFKFRKKKGKATGVGGEWHMDNFSSKPNFSPIWGETKPPKIWAQGENNSLPPPPKQKNHPTFLSKQSAPKELYVIEVS